LTLKQLTAEQAHWRALLRAAAAAAAAAAANPEFRGELFPGALPPPSPSPLDLPPTPPLPYFRGITDGVIAVRPACDLLQHRK